MFGLAFVEALQGAMHFIKNITVEASTEATLIPFYDLFEIRMYLPESDHFLFDDLWFRHHILVPSAAMVSTRKADAKCRPRSGHAAEAALAKSAPGGW